MTKRILPLFFLLMACPSKGGPTTDPGVTLPSGPRTCDDTKYTDMLVNKAALNKSEVGAACTKDYECFIGQVCEASKCATKSTDEKLQGEVELKAAGNYIVSVFSPVDDPSEAAAGDLEFKFESFPARDEQPRIYQAVRRNLSIDPIAHALLTSRVSYEADLRRGEWHALQMLAQNVGSPIRATSCGPTEFGYKGSCVAEGVVAGTFAFVTPPPEQTLNMSLKVYKVTGQTAILLDVADTFMPSELSAIDSLATKFDTVVGPRDRQLFNAGRAHADKLDYDQNGLIAIVLSKKVGTVAGLAGIYQYRDVLPPDAAGSTKNETDMLWAVPPGLAFTPRGTMSMVTSTEDYVLGTLAHEYQHVINFARAQEVAATPPKQETLFLNEGLSHLAEDLSGYGASNITSIAAYLSYPELVGLLYGSKGVDQDSSEMRGLGYLYLRYAFEKAGGYSNAGKTFTDKGGIAMLEKFYTTKLNGVQSLWAIVGSSFCNYPLFFPALAISNNPAVELATVKMDPRFNYAAPTTDPVTMQPVGINLWDSTRKDAFGNDNILKGYVAKQCDTTQHAEGGCVIFASGGVSFLWEDAPAMGTVTLKGPSANNVRLALVKVK